MENVYVLNGTTAESCNLETPELNTTLGVTKTVTCTPLDTIPLAASNCQLILSNTPPSSFNITVTGNNANPSQFAGSNDSVVVNLDAGNYEVFEITPGVAIPAGTAFLTTSFAGNCTDDPNEIGSSRAIGTIETGDSQTCDILNDFRTMGPLQQP